MGEVSGELLTMLVEEGVTILYYLFSSFSFSKLLGGISDFVNTSDDT